MSDTPSSGDPLHALAPRKALAEDVVEQLRLLIVRGHFEPGAHLREQRLAAALNISRGPIRQALGQLEREGLVMRRPNRGSVVARLSREDLEEVYSIRLALEPLALSWAAERATAHDFERLDAAVGAIEAGFSGEATVQEAAQLDVAFHDVVYDAAHHQRLKRVWTDLRSQVYLFLLSRRYVGTEDFGEFMVRQHVALVDALRTGDPAQAREIGESHVRASYRRVIEGYEKNRDASGGA
jgi:DNA-binding GntR family transcriptional regulator